MSCQLPTRQQAQRARPEITAKAEGEVLTLGEVKHVTELLKQMSSELFNTIQQCGAGKFPFC